MDSLVQKMHVDPSDSIHYLHSIDSAFSSIKQPGTGDLWDKYRFKWSYYYFHKHPAKSMPFADSMIELSHDSTSAAYNASTYAKSLFCKGDALFAQQHFDEAFNWYYQGQRIIFQTNDSCSFADYSGRLATVSYRQKKYAQAVTYYKQAMQQAEPCNKNHPFIKFAAKQGMLDNIGINYSRLQMADSASLYFIKALQYIDENKDRFNKINPVFIATAIAVIKGNQADVAIQLGHDSGAIRLLNESIAINSKPHYAPEDAVYSRIKLARIYIKHNDIAGARRTLDECVAALDTINNLELKQNYYQLQAALFAASNNPGQAYTSLAKSIQFKDSLAAVLPAITTLDIHEEFDFIERKNQLLLLQQKTKLQSFYLAVLLLAGIMGAVITALILKNSRQSKKHIRSLTKTLEALEKSQEDNSRLTAIVAHDLRNPIGAMTSFAGLMLDEVKDEVQRSTLRLMQLSGNNALQLITDLLLLDPSKSNTVTEPVDIDELLQYCVNLLQHKATEKKQQVILQTVHATIHGDRGKLWRVFSNLISNAIKFSPQNATIKVSMHIHHAHIHVVVEDHGIGIPDDLKSSIFEISVKAKRKGTEGEPSFGLGLLISKQIIELHNGKIWFTSEAGKGTTFHIELPLNKHHEN